MISSRDGDKITIAPDTSDEAFLLIKLLAAELYDGQPQTISEFVSMISATARVTIDRPDIGAKFGVGFMGLVSALFENFTEAEIRNTLQELTQDESIIEGIMSVGREIIEVKSQILFDKALN